MKIEKRTTKEGIVQVTTLDERFYEVKDIYFPSVTWIAQYYPKSEGFNRWLADKGWDESQLLKNEAAARGSIVHQAIEKLTNGETIHIEDKFFDNHTEAERETTPMEWLAILSFVNFWKEYELDHSQIIGNEFVVVNEEVGYAGTVDLAVMREDQLWLIDFKTSKEVYPSHEIQLSAYKYADPVSDEIRGLVEPHRENLRTAILQLGYTRNKKGWKFTEIEDKFHLFKATYQIWKNENDGSKPHQMNLPVELKL